MDMRLNTALVENYKSNSQKTRVMSEDWVGKNVFCPVCGNPHICNLENNKPVADLQCSNCGEIFELKSKKGELGKKIPDGAYSTMVERINSITNPDLFVLQYNNDYKVTDLMLIPKFFFVESIIQKRKPLPPTARRAGWVGCNILFGEIPCQGQIEIIHRGVVRKADDVVMQYNKIKALQTNNIENRGWLIDVLNCVNKTNETEFSLEDVYKFSKLLQDKHPDNHHIEAKIRQQLQVLRNKGAIEFLGQGKYRKLI